MQHADQGKEPTGSDEIGFDLAFQPFKQQPRGLIVNRPPRHIDCFDFARTRLADRLVETGEESLDTLDLGSLETLLIDSADSLAGLGRTEEAKGNWAFAVRSLPEDSPMRVIAQARLDAETELWERIA